MQNFQKILAVIQARFSSGIFAALSSAVFLGISPVFAKLSLQAGFTPLAVVALRTSFAAGLLLLIFIIFYRRFLYIFPVGLIGCIMAGAINGFGSLLYFQAINRLDISVAQLLYSLYPFFVAIWLVLDNEPLSRLTKIRILLAITAVLLLTTVQRDNTVDLTGALMMIGASLLYALHLPINQRVLFEVPAPTVTLYTLLSMSAVVLPAYFIFDFTLPTSPNTNWFPLLGLTIATFISRISLFFGVKRIGGMQTALLGLSELFVTLFFGHLLLNDTLTTMQWIGAFLLGVSLFMINFEQPIPPKRGASGWLSWIRSPTLPKDFWRTFE